MADPFDLNGAAEAPPAGDYLAALNETQVEAVEATEGPLLVLAGAGTGKTRVLTTRLAHILLTARAWPNQVLAVTFTNKAARQMKDRVAALINRNVDDLWLGTFHAIAARILRRHAELIGLKSNYSIIDADHERPRRRLGPGLHDSLTAMALAKPRGVDHGFARGDRPQQLMGAIAADVDAATLELPVEE